ncbi:AAA family ATPase [Acinetobacter calcoaceticus]|uniref:AAA family ATPase n=1 Tax=Acinetobacter calcoaceticus TaxID=471 RepID=UPI0002CFE838|nr:DUF3696 domain-containing protein [Acinetobacter calcoaceticus]ENU11225.1 hypothetical protein F997_00236 [Acinetobacter calcoaceticus NIPH 13]KUM10735.1 hypothetical protein AV645_11015 [Acinetobacter calcoaceticus]
MITNYSIENFKVFEKKTELNFSPITLIYGPNSSGKSSIIQSLLILKESLLKPNKANALRSNNDYFQLGGYASVVNKHEINKDIKFEFTTDLLTYKFSYCKNNLNSFKGSFLYEMIVAESKTEKKLFEFVGNKEENFLNLYQRNISREVLEKFLDKEISGKGSFDFIAKTFENNSNNRNREKIVNKFKGEMFFKRDQKIFPDILSSKEVDSHKKIGEGFNINDINSVVTRVIERNIDSDLARKDFILNERLSRLSYIGPLRPHPKRMYAIENNINNTVGQVGENFLNFLTVDESYLKDINNILSDFGVKYNIELYRNDHDVIGDTVSLILRHRENGLTATLVDVGFGIGQLLPILIEGLVKSKSTICIEQPEIHLHPKLQANLANFFAKDIQSSKANQWIIETHSEALLLRFQRLVRHKVLKPNDISIIYVDPTKEEKIIHIPLDEEGDFTVAWPNGFFEERLDEMFGDNPFGGK